MIKTTNDGKELLEKKALKEVEEDYEDNIGFLDFMTKLEVFCDDKNLPLNYVHVVKDEYFPEFIRNKWQELYLRDNTDFGFTPFGHLINWREAIEEAKEDYFSFVHDNEFYWIGI